MLAWCAIWTLMGTSITFAALPTLNPRQNLTVRSSNDTWYGPVVALPGGEALLTDHGPDHYVRNNPQKVVRLDRYGRVVPPAFTCRTRETIGGLVVDGDDVFVLQGDGTISKTRLSSLSHTQAEWRVMNDNDVCFDPEAGVLVGTELYLVDYFKKIAFSFNLENNSTTITTTGLNHPGSIATATLDRTQRLFFISELFGHRISIFNATWDLISTIGGQRGSGDGQLHHPRLLVVTPWSTLLVADTFNHRVTEFSLSGRFLRHLVTSRDGLYHPSHISYSHPYLWVVHETRGRGPHTVRRYQLVL